MGILELIEQGRVRRLFRARNKIVYPGAIIHATQHAAGDDPLFLEEADYLYMLYIVKEVVKKFNLSIFSFTLMPNHVHLLLKLIEANLPEAMKLLFGNYAKFFNRKYERKGHLFSGRYRTALCFDESYLLAISLYFILMPVRQG